MHFFVLELYDRLSPAHCVGVVVWLSHEDCDDNGGIYETAGGILAKCESICTILRYLYLNIKIVSSLEDPLGDHPHNFLQNFI